MCPLKHRFDVTICPVPGAHASAEPNKRLAFRGPNVTLSYRIPILHRLKAARIRVVQRHPATRPIAAYASFAGVWGVGTTPARIHERSASMPTVQRHSALVRGWNSVLACGAVVAWAGTWPPARCDHGGAPAACATGDWRCAGVIGGGLASP